MKNIRSSISDKRKLNKFRYMGKILLQTFSTESYRIFKKKRKVIGKRYR